MVDVHGSKRPFKIKLEICVTHGQSSGFKKPAEREDNVEKSRKKTRFVQQLNEALKWM